MLSMHYHFHSSAHALSLQLRHRRLPPPHGNSYTQGKRRPRLWSYVKPYQKDNCIANGISQWQQLPGEEVLNEIQGSLRTYLLVFIIQVFNFVVGTKKYLTGRFQISLKKNLTLSVFRIHV